MANQTLPPSPEGQSLGPESLATLTLEQEPSSCLCRMVLGIHFKGHTCPQPTESPPLEIRGRKTKATASHHFAPWGKLIKYSEFQMVAEMWGKRGPYYPLKAFSVHGTMSQRSQQYYSAWKCTDSLISNSTLRKSSAVMPGIFSVGWLVTVINQIS